MKEDKIMKLVKCVGVALAGALLASCAAAPAVIADLEEDKVVVASGMGTTDAMVQDQAQKGCAMHGRYAVAISHGCLDQYCIQKRHLFACQKP